MRRDVLLLALAFAAWATSWFLLPHKALDVERTAGGAVLEYMQGMSATPERADRSEVPRSTRTLPEDAPYRVTRAMEPFLQASGARLPYADGPPGWRAFRVAWDRLLAGLQFERGEVDRSRGTDLLLGSTSLTNGLFLAAIACLVAGAGATTLGRLGLASLTAAGLDLAWVYANSVEFVRDLRPGYSLWVVSFSLLGLGLRARATRVERADAASKAGAPPPPATAT